MLIRRLAVSTALLAIFAVSAPALADESNASSAASAPKKPGSRAPGAALLTLGGAGLGAGVIFGVLSTIASSDAKSQCNGTVCPPAAQPDIVRSRNFEAASIAAYIAGGTLVATGLVLTIVAPGGGGGSASIHPIVGPATAGAGLKLTF
jgi:hypothetical protein